MTAKAIMVLGTSSHVGKSLLTAALCRIFAQEGYRVAPFKSQNMSLNSAATPEGLEIGRAQALQAEAAGIAASVHMNPILLKPTGQMSSQVVVRGQIWGQLSASEYHLRRVEELMPLVTESYEKLAGENDVVLIEGAGSPAEINLKQHDIVNMRIAKLSGAACILVGDIDRGGVFASLLGTVLLLDPDEQVLVRGFVINKFRGDPALLGPGILMMEEKLAKPCLGVIPNLTGLSLDEEDSVAFSDLRALRQPWPESDNSGRALRIAVIALPSFSNFTDFDSLRSEPSVSLRFCEHPAALLQADMVILPGSKQTVHDLAWMRRTGMAEAVTAHAKASLSVGICGGYQMMGQEIADPHGVEYAGSVAGLGLLPIRTEMQRSKTTRLASAVTVAAKLFDQAVSSLRIIGYEIHIGTSTLAPGGSAFAKIESADVHTHPATEGCISADSRTLGTYIHGLFDHDDFRHSFINAARAFHGLDNATCLERWSDKREQSLNRLADEVRSTVNMTKLFEWVGLPYPGRQRKGLDVL
jgi:adenosylcobyric acid synthase